MYFRSIKFFKCPAGSSSNGTKRIIAEEIIEEVQEDEFVSKKPNLESDGEFRPTFVSKPSLTMNKIVKKQTMVLVRKKVDIEKSAEEAKQSIPSGLSLLGTYSDSDSSEG